MSIRCEIVTQDKSLFEGDVDIVIVPGSEGEMGILPGHAPLLATLGYGILRVRTGDEEHAFTIAGGVIEARPNVVTVLADIGENVEEIDVQRAEAAKTRAEELLKRGPPPDTDEYLSIQAALRRSKIRLDAV
ncbi:MAG: ATP synthase F1 subunit epsilon, partial [Anaerolineales bacterium]